jgi:hypothetical protein
VEYWVIIDDYRYIEVAWWLVRYAAIAVALETQPATVTTPIALRKAQLALMQARAAR